MALETAGVNGRVLLLTLLEARFHVWVASSKFTRQIQRLHRRPGLLPSIFQPDEATHTLRDYVQLRGNLVRLSGQHIQRMQKALERMTLKLTRLLGDVTGVTGLKIIRAILAGERDRTGWPSCATGGANTPSLRSPRRWAAAIGPNTSRSCAAAWRCGRSARG